MHRVLLIGLLLSIPAGAQYTPQQQQQQQRRAAQRGNATASTGAYNDPAATMHGVLKKLTSKQLVIATDEDQTVTITRTHKTKFLRKGKEIKPSEIAIGSIVSIDVGLFPDLSPQAVNVMVDLPPIGSTEMMNLSTDSKAPEDSKPVDAKQPPAKPAESPNQ